MKTFDNGLRLVTKLLPHTEAVSVFILVGAGSRYETKDISGISHFLEHMFFKGAEKYPNTKAVSEAVEGVGGNFNAFTSNEYAGYYVTVAADKIDIALSVLTDMMLKSKFDPAEIEKERGVIIEELNMYEDMPMSQAHEAFDRACFGDEHPLGWKIVGTKELISSVTQEQFKEYFGKLYTPDNMVIAVAGNFDAAKLEQTIGETFGVVAGKKAYNHTPLNGFGTPQSVLITKDTEQTHLVLGYINQGLTERERYAAYLLATILGGNMSSRMFLRIREAKGMAYYIGSASQNFDGANVFYTRAGVSIDRATEAISDILAQYKEVVDTGVTDGECERAKAYIIGTTILGLEDCMSYAEQLAEFQLLHGKEFDFPTQKALIESIKLEEINAVACKLFNPNALRLGIIGPYSAMDNQFVLTPIEDRNE